MTAIARCGASWFLPCPLPRAKTQTATGMFELGCHVIDLVINILGSPDKVTAYFRHSAPVDDALLDNMLAVFEYPRATATVKSSDFSYSHDLMVQTALMQACGLPLG